MADNTSFERKDKESLSKFSKKMIHLLNKYKPPRLFTGCYSELKLTEGKFFSEKTIGQLVGKSGERKEEFFNLTGVKPHIEYVDNDPVLVLSKYNVREIKLATLLGQRFNTTKSWSSSSINKHSMQIKNQLSSEEKDIGSKILEKFDSEKAESSLTNTVGKMMNEQYSSTQTLLEHSIEVAESCGKAALALSLDSKKIQKIAFYHDIGKVFFPYYMHTSEKVLELLPELQDKEVQDGILLHHNTLTSISSPYIFLVALINKVISQNHFISKKSEEPLILKELFNNFLSSKQESFFILSSGYHFWFIFNCPSDCGKIIEEITLPIENIISKHAENYTIVNINISVYFLPKEGESALFERIKLTKQYSIH